jgi:hypothetical protein
MSFRSGTTFWAIQNGYRKLTVESNFDPLSKERSLVLGIKGDDRPFVGFELTLEQAQGLSDVLARLVLPNALVGASCFANDVRDDRQT